MFEHLLQRFRARPAQPEPLPAPDAQLALGTLLVRVAMADRAYLFEEIEQIDRVLAHAFDLNPIEAAKLRARCEKFSTALPDDVDLAGIIRETVDYAHRIEAVAGLWAVVLADQITDDREAAIVDLVEAHLGVSNADSTAAQQAFRTV